MAQSCPLVQRILASSVTVAARAGKIIRDVMSDGDLAIVDKGKNDLQTEADRSAQRCIMATLSQQFPKVAIIGEEGPSNCEVPSDWVITEQDQDVLTKSFPTDYANIPDGDIVIWVDPLDGTAEYTQGFLEHVTVLIGIAVKGKAVAGVIHQPYFKPKQNKTDNNLGRTVWGCIGMGVGGFTPIEPPQQLIVTTSRTHADNIVQMALDALHPHEVIKVGGSGHKVMSLMEGKASAYVFASKGCKKWDTCAPEAILTSIGGKLTDVHGESYCYDAIVQHPNVGGVFATAKGVNHGELLTKLPQEIRDILV